MSDYLDMLVSRIPREFKTRDAREARAASVLEARVLAPNDIGLWDCGESQFIVTSERNKDRIKSVYTAVNAAMNTVLSQYGLKPCFFMSYCGASSDASGR
jgi:hypothetical protein